MTELDRLSEELHQTFENWKAMIRDHDRCHSKIEHLKADLATAENMEAAQSIAAQIMTMGYAATQYELQIKLFPGRIAEIRKKLTFVSVKPSEIHRYHDVSTC